MFLVYFARLDSISQEMLPQGPTCWIESVGGARSPLIILRDSPSGEAPGDKSYRILAKGTIGARHFPHPESPREVTPNLLMIPNNGEGTQGMEICEGFLQRLTNISGNLRGSQAILNKTKHALTPTGTTLA